MYEFSRFFTILAWQCSELLCYWQRCKFLKLVHACDQVNGEISCPLLKPFNHSVKRSVKRVCSIAKQNREVSFRSIRYYRYYYRQGRPLPMGQPGQSPPPQVYKNLPHTWTTMRPQRYEGKDEMWSVRAMHTFSCTEMPATMLQCYVLTFRNRASYI
jgi:hypothetical protein